MKADLLDDEFLSLKEAIGQWSKRIVPAIMVPTFLILTVFGFIVLIYGVNLVSSIPYVGPNPLRRIISLGFLAWFAHRLSRHCRDLQYLLISKHHFGA